MKQTSSSNRRRSNASTARQPTVSGATVTATPLANLKSHPNNARTHPPRQLRQIARSIQRFGFVTPILIDGNGQIIAGHARAAGAKLAGLDCVPTLTVEHLTEAEKRAYVLADNRLAEKAGWDRQLLAIELQGLIDINFDLGAIGFEMAEVDLLLEEAADGQDAPGPEDDIPAYNAKVSVTRPGDQWVLGQHIILCADARDGKAYRDLLGGAKAQFVFTDPPYNVPIDGNVCGLGRVRHKNFSMGCGEMSRAEFTSFLEECFELLASHTTNGSIHQICMDWRHFHEMLAAGHRVYPELKNLCVWNKTNSGMGSFYRSKHEMVFVWKSGKAPHINNFELGQHGRTRSNVWDYAGVNCLRPGRMEELAMHPTVKPVALVADAIKDCSHRGALVLDPFAGSGTILIAAERTGRKARAIEIDPHYVDVAVRRWQTYSGKQAVHAESRESFEDREESNRGGAAA